MKSYWDKVESIENAIKVISKQLAINEERPVPGLKKLVIKAAKYFGTENIEVKLSRNVTDVLIKMIIDGETEVWTPTDFAETLVNVGVS